MSAVSRGLLSDPAVNDVVTVHTAIVVDDTERSLRFYRDTLGLRIVGASENHGPEQDAEAAAAKLGASSGTAARPVFVSIADSPLGFRRGLTVADPDGHEVQLRAR